MDQLSRKFKFGSLYIAVVSLIVAPLLVFRAEPVNAGDLIARKLVLSDYFASSVATHTFSFELANLANLGSIRFLFCENTPIPTDPCDPPVGFDATAATIDNQTGQTGFAIHASSTANDLVIHRSAAVPATASVSYEFGNITNPSVGPATYYVRLATYTTEDGTGPSTDIGGIAYVIVDSLSLSLFVPPFLSFCAASAIPVMNCSSATGSNIDLGVFDEGSASFGTSQFLVQTNAASGYNVSYSGFTMTSGNNPIPSIGNLGASNPGSSQFGFNLRDNSNPNVGANPNGLVTGGPTANYNVVNRYSFSSGAVAASSTMPDDARYTASYVVNINPNQAPGYYSTTLTYVAFATF